MVPVKVASQGTKKLVQDSGNAYDAEHGAILLLPLAGGRWLHFFTTMEDCLSRRYCQALDTIFPRKISQLEELLTVRTVNGSMHSP
jgi:hypothetical protein